MTNPNSIQKAKQSRVSRRNLTKRLLQTNPTFRNGPVISAPIATRFDENGDVPMTEVSNSNMMSAINLESFNMPTEQELREEEEEHDRYLEGETSDVDDDEGVETDEIQRAREFFFESITEDNEMEEMTGGKYVVLRFVM